MDNRIPEQYAPQWEPFITDGVLYHLTSRRSLEEMYRLGHIVPRDPAPKYWAGMQAVFMADPTDPRYEQTLPNVVKHVRNKREALVRLHIRTANELWKSTDPERTFQVMSLDPISIGDVVEVEGVARQGAMVDDSGSAERTESRYRAKSWLNPSVEVRPSSIEGQGLFAREPIAEGGVVAVMGGRVIAGQELESIKRTGRFSAAAIGEDRNLVQDEDDPFCLGNHSCDSNLWLADEVTFIARGDIKAGEELTTDYALLTVNPEWSMECHCGAEACRRTVRGDDWRRPDVQARYRGHFSPFIDQRIANSSQ
jgi:uncharacterized protein